MRGIGLQTKSLLNEELGCDLIGTVRYYIEIWDCCPLFRPRRVSSNARIQPTPLLNESSISTLLKRYVSNLYRG